MKPLSFRHDNTTISLPPGRTWSAPSRGDSYRDTPPENLRAILTAMEQGEPWREVIARHYEQSHPWLYRIITSPARDLFLRQHPPAKGGRVLDVGAGWGQISLPLALRGDLQVTALEPTPERLEFIRAAALQECAADHMQFVQADFLELEFTQQFDTVCCIGVLEWVPRFRAGDPRELQVEFLRRARQCLNPGGQLVIGIENRMGLKYLLGARDDHLGVPGVGVYDASLAATKWSGISGQELRCFTFTRAELDALLHEAGFNRTRFYAALPDYKVPDVILPLDESVDRHFIQGGFSPEHDGSNGEPLPFQAELKSHYQSLAALGIAGNFAPSFFVVAENTRSSADDAGSGRKPNP